MPKIKPGTVAYYIDVAVAVGLAWWLSHRPEWTSQFEHFAVFGLTVIMIAVFRIMWAVYHLEPKP